MRNTGRLCSWLLPILAQNELVSSAEGRLEQDHQVGAEETI
jgi:hypothetical protein